ncbi:MAG TPA: ABC transporter ATP-binding protein [Spirochaetota bacterium]|jgi:cobalt/nickel transport system ATP-binding protein|nr:ABC transporter ATP-binding protein [Spirochaetota bacterium]HON17401.1 ABC transporter ATP-binding protein [Spirochaetota bacterium]HOQ11809.1 ABC transporter ATP-binding protein [Spirochaetota bacterium]HOV08924.1 ABC transporter ATP-binding protein [Spirochaetota bacterium]HPX91622.1 ABC transporter ATP-binding protein [Spirochaetota bacterium]
MSHHIVQAEDLHYTYPDGKVALQGLSFLITHGESVAIIGANGAGKSTLLMHLNGVILPQKGMVRIGEMPVTRETLPNIRRTVGTVFQDSDDQLFMPTVFDDVAFGPLNLGFPKEEVEKKVRETLEKVGALHLINRATHRLSGGEKRSVAIATVLAMAPDILVMDEPTSNLDPKSRRNLIELLKSFTHTKIIATHDLDMAMDLCTRTIVLSEGKIIADGPTSDILINEQLLHKSHLEKPLSLQGCPICNKK